MLARSASEDETLVAAPKLFSRLNDLLDSIDIGERQALELLCAKGIDKRIAGRQLFEGGDTTRAAGNVFGDRVGVVLGQTTGRERFHLSDKRAIRCSHYHANPAWQSSLDGFGGWRSAPAPPKQITRRARKPDRKMKRFFRSSGIATLSHISIDSETVLVRIARCHGRKRHRQS